MRVLLTNHFPLHGSGTGTYTHDLAVGLLRAGHEVHALVVDSRADGDDPFPVRRVVCRPDDQTADLPFGFPCFTSHPQSTQSFYTLTDDQIGQYRQALRRHLDAEISDFDPHVVHAQHIWIMGHLVLEAGAPYVLSAQGTDLMGYAADARYRRFAAEAAENAGRILAASDFIRRQVLSTFDISAQRVETLYSAIDIRPYESPPPRAEALESIGLPPGTGPLVAFVGKLARFKGVDTLLNAAAVYEQDPRRPTTLIVGDGGQRAELEAQARRLGLRRVQFLGDRGRRFCAAVYAAADLVVMPSRGEPLGLVALEAMASGTPVLGTSAGGLAEILRDETGGLVPVDDHELLAEAVLRAIDDDWKRSKGPAAREYVREHHNPECWVRAIVERYEQVIADRGGRVT
ncbi:MAG: glycosyltransferase family 4 protein [Pirellulales bacterium]